MIVYDAFHLIGLTAFFTLIVVYIAICIICRIADRRKNREERINEKLQEKYDKGRITMLTLKIEIKGDITEEGLQETHAEIYKDVYCFARDDTDTFVIYGQPNKAGLRQFSIWKNDRVSSFYIKELRDKEENKNAETS